MANKVESADEGWKDEDGKTIQIKDCMDACYLAMTLFTKELEFNEKVKSDPARVKQYKRAQMIIGKMRENWERAYYAMKKVRLVIPKEN